MALSVHYWHGGSTATFPADTYAPTVAYSVRKVRSAYSGSCMRVRRVSDNVEQDIGFVSNVLDVTSLLSFLGSVEGRVVTWYDQMVYKDLVTAASAEQGRIATGGVVESNGGQYGVNFLGTSKYYIATGGTGWAMPASISAVVQVDPTNTNYETICGDKDPLATYGFQVVVRGNGTASRAEIGEQGVLLVVQTSYAMAAGNHIIWGTAANGGSHTDEVGYDGNYTTSTGSALRFDGVTVIGFDGQGVANHFFQKQMSEIIMWNSQPGNTVRNFWQADQKAFFGTP